jgi:hypothetical protein
MRCEPISPLYTLSTFFANSEQNIKLSHNFSLLSRFFWRILYMPVDLQGCKTGGGCEGSAGG